MLAIFVIPLVIWMIFLGLDMYRMLSPDELHEEPCRYRYPRLAAAVVGCIVCFAVVPLGLPIYAVLVLLDAMHVIGHSKREEYRHYKKVADIMRQHPNREWQRKELTRFLQIEAGTLDKILKRLKHEGKVKEELYETSQPPYQPISVFLYQTQGTV